MQWMSLVFSICHSLAIELALALDLGKIFGFEGIDIHIRKVE
jgi:hypothetical protein